MLTVKELIEALKKLPQEHRIRLTDSHSFNVGIKSENVVESKSSNDVYIEVNYDND